MGAVKFYRGVPPSDGALVLGYGGFVEREIRAGVVVLEHVLSALPASP